LVLLRVAVLLQVAVLVLVAVAEGSATRVLLPVAAAVPVPVDAAVRVPVAADVPVPLDEGVPVCDDVSEDEAVPVSVALALGVPVSVADALAVPVCVPDALGVPVADADTEPVSEPDADTEPVAVVLGEGVPVRELLVEGVPVRLGVLAPLAETEPVVLGDGVAVPVLLVVDDGVALGLVEPDGVPLGLGCATPSGSNGVTLTERSIVLGGDVTRRVQAGAAARPASTSPTRTPYTYVVPLGSVGKVETKTRASPPARPVTVRRPWPSGVRHVPARTHAALALPLGGCSRKSSSPRLRSAAHSSLGDAIQKPPDEPPDTAGSSAVVLPTTEPLGAGPPAGPARIT